MAPIEPKIEVVPTIRKIREDMTIPKTKCLLNMPPLISVKVQIHPQKSISFRSTILDNCVFCTDINAKQRINPYPLSFILYPLPFAAWPH
jgi:hypothetical protein